MTGVFYFVAFILIVFVLALVAYYGWRLMKVSRVPDDSRSRFQAFMGDPRRDAGPGSVTRGGPAGVPAGGTHAGPAAPLGDVPVALGGPRVYDRTVGLRRLSEAPVFLRRDASGDVYFQVDDRPPAPLKYLLDAVGRKILQEVAGQASLDFGPSWSVLADEDHEGRLVLTRLT